MIFDDAVDEVKEAEQEPEKIVILATVTSLTSGKALVKFNGETEPATKAYPYIEGYKPAVNDVVCMLKQGNTFVIIGKVSNSDITTNYAVFAAELATILADYLLSSTAASTYLSQTDAANTYLSQTDASSTYLSQTDAASTYLSQTDASNTYRGKDAYFDRLGSGNNNISISGQTASVNGTLDLGTSNKRFRSVTTSAIDTDVIRTPTGTALFDITSGHMDPSSNNGTSVGTSSKKLNNLYATNIYGSVADSSDRRVKKAIKTLGRRWLEFFYRLRPTSFKYKDGTSDRTHTGFIAQEVEAAANEVGIDTKDIATIVVDSDGRYYLRYEELIAVQTLAIQDLKAQVDDLTARIHDLERVIYK